MTGAKLLREVRLTQRYLEEKQREELLREDAALAEVVRRLVEAYEPERIYLFGSKARGQAGPDSDYDLLLIVRDDALPERRRSRLAYEVLRGTGTAADVLVWLKSKFERRAHVVASLPGTVLREGRLIFTLNDPELVDETRTWLVKAANDLRAVDALREAEPPLFGDMVFHCQQATEKALKGFLTWHSRPFGKTHNLEEIGEQCLKLDATLKEVVGRATPLTDYAWKFRYPGQADEPSREETEEALTTARQVCEAVLARLPKEVRP